MSSLGEEGVRKRDVMVAISARKSASVVGEDGMGEGEPARDLRRAVKEGLQEVVQIAAVPMRCSICARVSFAGVG